MIGTILQVWAFIAILAVGLFLACCAVNPRDDDE